MQEIWTSGVTRGVSPVLLAPGLYSSAVVVNIRFFVPQNLPLDNNRDGKAYSERY